MMEGGCPVVRVGLTPHTCEKLYYNLTHALSLTLTT